METRLLFRRIGQKHFAFQIRIDTDFIAQNTVFMSKMCSNSLLSKLSVAFLNRNDYIVVQSSLLSSGLPDKNHLCAEKPTRSRLVKIKNPCYNPFLFKFGCEILRLHNYSHISCVYTPLECS